MRAEHPGIVFDVHDGTTADLMDKFMRGAFDFLLECDARPHVDLNRLMLPQKDTWGIYCRRDDPLAERAGIAPSDLAGKPVILSSQASKQTVARWLGDAAESIEVVATYNLLLNSTFMATPARAGQGLARTRFRDARRSFIVMHFVQLKLLISQKRKIMSAPC